MILPSLIHTSRYKLIRKMRVILILILIKNIRLIFQHIGGHREQWGIGGLSSLSQKKQPDVHLCIPVLSRVMSMVAICQYQYVNANILFPVFIASEGRDLIVVCNVKPIFLSFQSRCRMFRLSILYFDNLAMIGEFYYLKKIFYILQHFYLFIISTIINYT